VLLGVDSKVDGFKPACNALIVRKAIAPRPTPFSLSMLTRDTSLYRKLMSRLPAVGMPCGDALPAHENEVLLMAIAIQFAMAPRSSAAQH